MANQNIDTTTPGSAVADQLQNILTRKRVEARQSMLDDINRQATEARINYENENAKSLAEQRAAMAQFRQSEADKNWLTGLGNNPTTVDQATYERGSKLAPGSFSMTPAVNTLPSTQISDAGVQASPSKSTPATYQYLGSPNYQEEQKTIKGMNDLYRDPSFAQLTPEQKLLKLASIPGSAKYQKTFESLLASKAETQGPAYFYNEDRHRLEYSNGQPVPQSEATKIRKDQVVNVPHAPRLPQEHGQLYVTGEGTKDQKAWNYDPATGAISPAKIIVPGDPNATLPPGFHRPGAGKAQTPPSLYGGKQAAALRTTFQRQGNSTALRQARESAEADFIKSISNEDIRNDVAKIRGDKRARMMSVDKIMPLVKPPTGLQDEASRAKYLSDLRDALSILPNYKRLQDEQ